MKPKLLITFTLIVALPLVVLGWLGVRFVRTETEMTQHRFTQVLEDQLRDFDADVVALLDERGRELMSLELTSTTTPDDIRALTRRSPGVNQFFVLDEDGEPLYPSARAMWTAQEEDFLKRWTATWRGREIVAEAEDESGKATGFSPGQSGWVTSYWDKGLYLSFWWREAEGNIVGAELNRVRLMADIIAVLPETAEIHYRGVEAAYALVDSNGDRIYQWGPFLPGPESPPDAAIALSRPLSTWRLEYYSSSPFMGESLGRGLMINVIGGLALLTTALIGLSLYFYREQSRDLREAQQRVNFVNQVSHELKTPLTSIRMYAELLGDEFVQAGDKPRKYLDVIISESQRLSRLIGNVLTFSRKQRNTLTIHVSQGVIDETLRKTIENFEPSLAKSGISLNFEGFADETVEFDHDVLEQIVGNLLNNVEKYARDADRVDVSSRRIDGTVQITVADNGPGIPPRERDRIFEPFHRISDKLTDGVAGTGIGLSIARDLARLHGGDLILETSDSGARFTVILRAPLAEAGESS